jgi:hypothetical protein
MSSFTTPTSSALAILVGPPTAASIAAAATGTGRLSEKSLELTFCAQFSAEAAFYHHVPWPHRIVWFGLTQLQENQLGFDAVTSLRVRQAVSIQSLRHGNAEARAAL